MPPSCSPARDGMKDSCLTTAELQSVAALYNEEETNKLNKIPLDAFKSRQLLLNSIHDKFAQTCKNKSETCWLEHGIIRKSDQLYNALQKAYRPPKPGTWKNNKREWLNTYDILNVMKQYEDKHTTFEFLGVFPVDFAKKTQQTPSHPSSPSCVVQSMCNFSVVDFKKRGKTSFGMVLNLDPHDKPGSHWVACYCCLDVNDPKYGICYYDSGGLKPPKPILDFIKNIYNQVDDPKHFQKRYNPTKTQFQDTECGIFSMLFIVLCLKHREGFRDTRKRIKTHRNDDWVHTFRDHFYR